MADAIDAVEIYELLKDKIGEKGARSLIRYVDERVEGRVATKDDVEKLGLSLNSRIDMVRADLEKKIDNMRADLEKKMDNMRVDLEKRMDALEWRNRLYFAILVVLIVVMNPKVLEFAGKVLGIVK